MGAVHAQAKSGSSPHTRGARRPWFIDARGWRIIPAYAGSTGGRSGRQPSLGDHPRIRGEHSRFSSPSAAITGSSPHTRGARSTVNATTSALRIIPAYAGSTRTTPPKSASGRDHPRIRGEHKAGFPALWISDGSSPHTRGAPIRAVAPVTAGQDHPRIRGEHAVYLFVAERGGGSSPHTRGAQPPHRRG